VWWTILVKGVGVAGGVIKILSEAKRLKREEEHRKFIRDVIISTLVVFPISISMGILYIIGLSKLNIDTLNSILTNLNTVYQIIIGIILGLISSSLGYIILGNEKDIKENVFFFVLKNTIISFILLWIIAPLAIWSVFKIGIWAFGFFKDYGIATLTFLTDLIISVWNFIKGVITSIIDFIKDVITSIIDLVKNFIG